MTIFDSPLSVMPHRPGTALFRSRERGAVMILALIGLSLLLLSTMALMRSFGTSLTLAGNLSFKRDLVNQGERGIVKAIKLIKDSSGALYSTTARNSNSLANNYSSTALATDPHGIPLALLNDTTFTTTLAMTGSDITDNGVTIRYLIDRLCDTTGAFSSSSCVTVNAKTSTGGSASQLNTKVGQDYYAVYRISVRVTGPRNTQAYLQATMSY